MSSSVPALSRATAETKRYTAHLIALCEPDERDTLTNAEGFEVTRLPYLGFRPWADWQLRRRINPLVRDSHVVHIHGIWREHCAAAGMLAAARGKPFVVSAHGMLERYALHRKRWKKLFYSTVFERLNLKRAGCLRALTTAEAEDYRRFGLSCPVAVIPNGVEVPARLDSQLFLDHYPQLRGRRLVLFLSRIHYKKGLDILCRAWAKVRTSFDDAHLVLAGPDFENTQQSVRQLVSDLQLSQCVTFTGMLTGEFKWSALAAAELFVLPSYSEGFSMATLEAMAAGLPVIITDRCYFPEVSVNQCGWIIEPTTEDLQTALREFLLLPRARATEMGANGRRLVENRYSWSVIGDQMADVYDWLLGAGKPRSVELLSS